MTTIFKDIVTWLKGWFYTKDEVNSRLNTRYITEDYPLPNLETTANANQHEINLAIDEKITATLDGISLACISDFVINTSDLDDVELELTACTGKVITQVAKTGTSGLVDTYTIYYNDNTTDTFTVTNGSNATVDIVTDWESTTSDSKVPSEKLVKDTIDNITQTLTGEIIVVTTDKGTANSSKMNKLYVETKNGKTDVYFVERINNGGIISFNWECLDEDILDNLSISWSDIQNKPSIPSSSSDLSDGSTLVKMSNTSGLLKNDGTVDTNNYLTSTNLSNYVQKSSTSGLLKNDGTVDTKPYFTVTSVTPLSSDDPKKDLNDYLTQGFYAFFMNNNIPNMEQTTLPSGLDNKSFYLLVERRSDTYVKQTVTRYDNGKTWIRTKDSSTWGSWSELSVSGHTHDDRYYTESEVDTALSSKVSTSDSRLSDARNPKITNLTTNDNVDEILTTGHYVLNDNVSIGGTMPSGTELTNKAFVLMVDGDNRTIRQTLTFYKGINRTFVRMYSGYSSNLGWSDWKELSTVGHTHTVNVTPTSDTDIDSYKDNGFYTFFNNSAVASMTEENKAKLPSGLGDNSFYLLVENKNNYAKQTLTKYDDSRTWIRIYNDNDSVQSWSAWQELSFVGKVTNVVPTSTDDPKHDLNNYLTQGFYTFFMNNNIQYMEQTTLPSGLGQKSFYLLVERKSDIYVKQTLTEYDNGKTWIRTKNLSTWSAWSELSVSGHTHSTSDITDLDLTNYQEVLESGVNIKTINNTSILGSGNINIQGGGGSVIGTGSFSINNQGHLIVELPSGVDNPYYINNNGHLIYDTSNTHNNGS